MATKIKTVKRVGLEVVYESFMAGGMRAGGGDCVCQSFESLAKAKDYVATLSHLEWFWVSWFVHDVNQCRLVKAWNRDGKWVIDDMGYPDEELDLHIRLAQHLVKRINSTRLPTAAADWPQNLSTVEILEQAGNCLRTACLAGGHFKAERNQSRADELLAELQRREYPITCEESFKKDLINNGTFNGPGSY